MNYIDKIEKDLIFIIAKHPEFEAYVKSSNWFNSKKIASSYNEYFDDKKLVARLYSYSQIRGVKNFELIHLGDSEMLYFEIKDVYATYNYYRGIK